MIILEDPRISMWIEDGGITIELFDSKSFKKFTKVKLTNDQFVSMLSNVHRIKCQIEVDNLDVIHKKMEHEKFDFEVKEGMAQENYDFEMSKENGLIHSSELRTYCLNALTSQNMTDWVPDNSYQEKDSFFSKDGKHFARTTIRRWS